MCLRRVKRSCGVVESFKGCSVSLHWRRDRVRGIQQPSVSFQNLAKIGGAVDVNVFFRLTDVESVIHG